MIEPRPNIWQLHSRRDLQGLIGALRYPDAEVRKRAAVALRSLELTEAVPALKAALAGEQDSAVRASINAALHVLDHQTNIDALLQNRNLDVLAAALKSRNEATAVAAARALAQLGDRAAVEPLVILFQNASAPPGARLAAAEALLALQSAPAVVTLLGALRRDAWQVRSNAAAVLGQIQATWAVEPLAQALGDTHPVVRRTAAAALRRIATPEANAALRAHFAPPSPEAPAVPAAEKVTGVASETIELKPAPAAPVAPAEKPSARPVAVSEPPLHGMDTRPSLVVRREASAETQPVTAPTAPVTPAPVVEQASPPRPNALKRLLAALRGTPGPK